MNRLKLLVRRLWSNVLVRRTVHTFWQAFLSVFLLGMPVIVNTFHLHGVAETEQALLALLIASGAAGLAALRTGVSNVLQVRAANKAADTAPPAATVYYPDATKLR